MNQMILTDAIGGISDRFLLEALEADESTIPPRSGIRRRFLLIAAVVCCFMLLSAFAVRLFSPLNGDALTLSGTYLGEGVVSIQVENRSSRDLRFQPQVKLVKWLGEEEISQLGGTPVFANEEIPAFTTQTMTVDLSEVYDIKMLEDSHPWQWYYLILTNRDFFFGHQWKCSINFGFRAPDPVPTEGRNYSLDPAVLENIEEELRPYFEDDYVGIFAANPMNYSYMQQAQEYLLRSGKHIVPLADAPIISEPIPDGLIVDETVAAQKQYSLSGDSDSVRDAFGKLVGATQSEKVHSIDVYMPAYKGAEDQAWSIPVIFLASFEKSKIQGSEDYAFIYGQIVSLESLEAYRIYEDAAYVSYNVTHLFYTDLRSYVENVVAMELAAENTNVYFDEQAFSRIENILAYYEEHMSVVSQEEYILNIRPRCTISGYPSGDALVRDGLSGSISSNKEIRKVVFTVATDEGEEVYRKEYIPEDPYNYSLDSAAEVTEEIRSLGEGVYTLDVSVWLSSDVMAFQSLWTQVFAVGNASVPGVG